MPCPILYYIQTRTAIVFAIANLRPHRQFSAITTAASQLCKNTKTRSPRAACRE
ncbi:MAG: hypothetical protein ICV55_08720 [Coleofasciculus sp. C3-bin4]|nr:hypothetical protein [Coleofasciculus sp. C3-bin4]